jgi:nitroreductase
LNEKLKLIFARRSVRRYQDKPIPEAMIKDLLEAAMAAPSAACKDPWRFAVITEKAMRERLAGALPNGKMLPQAAMAIVVCGELGAAHDRQISYLLQDCGAAVENMLLAATALELGACWLGVHPREDRMEHIRRLLSLPVGVVAIAIVAVGWPAEKTEPRTRYVEANVHRGAW